MSERDDALKALQRLHDGAFICATDRGGREDDLEVSRDHDTLRSAIDRAYPPEEDEDEDPVGAPAGERWIIEISAGNEWARVPLGPAPGFTTKAEAQHWAQHMPSARVRRVDDDGEPPT